MKFGHPTILTAFPASSPCKAAVTICSALRLGSFPSSPALFENTVISVFAAPGHKAMIRTPDPRTSSERASVKDSTKALVAA